jgi:hypothetical protein
VSAGLEGDGTHLPTGSIQGAMVRLTAQNERFRLALGAARDQLRSREVVAASDQKIADGIDTLLEERCGTLYSYASQAGVMTTKCTRELVHAGQCRGEEAK